MGTRVGDREDFEAKVRLRLIEGDLDKFDEWFNQLDARISKILWALVSATISFAVATLTLAFTIMRAA